MLCPLVKPDELYAFSYNPKMPKENREVGWKLIDISMDYQRMGIPNDYWEITDANKDYEVFQPLAVNVLNVLMFCSENLRRGLLKGSLCKQAGHVVKPPGLYHFKL